MNREEREALTERATARLVACLHQRTNAEELIGSMLTGYGVAMFAAGGRTTEQWIGRIVASLPIPMLITRTLPEGSGEQEPVGAYHWKTRDREGDAVTFAYGLEQALLSVMHRQEQQPGASTTLSPGDDYLGDTRPRCGLHRALQCTSLAASGLDGETASIAPKMDTRYALMSTGHITFCAKVSLMHLLMQVQRD